MSPPPRMPSYLAHEDDPRVGELRRRLDAFYSSTADYSDFHVEATSKPEFWGPVREAIEARLGAGGACRVLEFGAGRTGFASFLGPLRGRVAFEVQDVTPQNREYLAGQADAVHIGDLRSVPGAFDVIFSTFVWEHVTNPKATLGVLLGMLEPGGSLFIACPRYDAPGYVPPSARHYGLARRLGVAWWLAKRRLSGGRGGAFAIHVDPAVLHAPWFRDADAIHWVALRDFFGLPPGYACERLRVRTRGLKAAVWERFLLAFVRIRREAGA